MREGGPRSRGRRQTGYDQRKRDLDRALADSADLLESVFSKVEPPAATDDFLACELGRLVEEDRASFESEEFRHLIQQGVRLEYDRDISLRARFALELRRSWSELDARARRSARHVIGAIEDVDFPLHRVGAVVRYYTNQLFSRLETSEPPPSASPLADSIDLWRSGKMSRASLIAALGHTDISVPDAAELLFEAADDLEVGLAAIDALSHPPHMPGAACSGARALAYAVSEPLLDEALEARACAALARTWPAASIYVLYNLRRHSHEDIPFRWMELLVATDELRAVDRILEEVLVHAVDPNYQQDLMAILDLIDRSPDPGRVGKVLRLLEGPQVPPRVATLLEEWAEASPHAAFLAEPRSEARHPFDFVHIGEDFSAFRTRLSDLDPGDVSTRWNEAYHESLGWLRWSELPRSTLELECQADIESATIRQLSFSRRPDEGNLRGLVESLKEQRLYGPPGQTPPLVEIYRTRPRDNPWLTDIYLREVNGLFVRAASSYDAGDLPGARHELDLVLAIEPKYPMAVTLDEVMRQ